MTRWRPEHRLRRNVQNQSALFEALRPARLYSLADGHVRLKAGERQSGGGD